MSSPFEGSVTTAGEIRVCTKEKYHPAGVVCQT